MTGRPVARLVVACTVALTISPACTALLGGLGWADHGPSISPDQPAQVFGFVWGECYQGVVPCAIPPFPLRAMVVARLRGGDVIGSTRSSRIGRYVLRLPSGQYVLSLRRITVPAGFRASCRPSEVALLINGARQLDLGCTLRRT